MCAILLIWPQPSSATPTLRSVTPSSAVQGNTLNLTFTGDGFTSASGSPTFSGTGVLVNGVRVVDSNMLIANVNGGGRTDPEQFSFLSIVACGRWPLGFTVDMQHQIGIVRKPVQVDV